jgi:hypothetical protein
VRTNLQYFNLIAGHMLKRLRTQGTDDERGLMRIPLRLLFVALLSTPLAAHHAEALFDHSQTHSVTGTVMEYLWANPHTNIFLEVTDASGHSSIAVFEGGSAIAMRRAGWTRESMSVGDKLTISFYRRRDLKSGGQLLSATLADGRTLRWQPAGTP